LEYYKDLDFVTWANNWLSGKDRSVESAEYHLCSCYVYYAAAIHTAAEHGVDVQAIIDEVLNKELI
jgi:hypothetical protein